MTVDYSVRYGEDYFKRVAIAMKHHYKLNGGVCCCCLVRRAKEMHHTEYGCDRLGSTWIPVCKRCHKQICHSPKNWIRLKGEAAVWGNHNTPEFAEKLKRNYRAIALSRRKSPRCIKDAATRSQS